MGDPEQTLAAGCVTATRQLVEILESLRDTFVMVANGHRDLSAEEAAGYARQFDAILETTREVHAIARLLDGCDPSAGPDRVM